MGRPVVHFEVIGKDPDGLRRYYGELFGWRFDVIGGPMDYSTVAREENVNDEGIGIGGGVGGAEHYDGHVTFYVEVPDVEAGLAQAESLGGSRVHGPDEVPDVGIMIGHFTDPEGHMIGLVGPAS
jgi:predicted enzyme related to lactoylglutathione lyase